MADQLPDSADAPFNPNRRAGSHQLERLIRWAREGKALNGSEAAQVMAHVDGELGQLASYRAAAAAEAGGPGSDEDVRKALLQLLDAMPRLYPHASGLSHAMGLLVRDAGAHRLSLRPRCSSRRCPNRATMMCVSTRVQGAGRPLIEAKYFRCDDHRLGNAVRVEALDP